MKLILTTFPSHKSAIKSVKVLAEKRLIACGQIDGPINSYYWWKGNLQEQLRRLRNKLNELSIQIPK